MILLDASVSDALEVASGIPVAAWKYICVIAICVSTAYASKYVLEFIQKRWPSKTTVSEDALSPEAFAERVRLVARGLGFNFSLDEWTRVLRDHPRMLAALFGPDLTGREGIEAQVRDVWERVKFLHTREKERLDIEKAREQIDLEKLRRQNNDDGDHGK